MDRYLKAQICVLALLLAMIAAAGCIRLISAERLEDGSAVMCVRVEPTDAGLPQEAGAVSTAPAMRYVPAYAPVPTGSAAP